MDITNEELEEIFHDTQFITDIAGISNNANIPSQERKPQETAFCIRSILKKRKAKEEAEAQKNEAKVNDAKEGEAAEAKLSKPKTKVESVAEILAHIGVFLKMETPKEEPIPVSYGEDTSGNVITIYKLPANGLLPSPPTLPAHAQFPPKPTIASYLVYPNSETLHPIFVLPGQSYQPPRASVLGYAETDQKMPVFVYQLPPDHAGNPSNFPLNQGPFANYPQYPQYPHPAPSQGVYAPYPNPGQFGNFPHPAPGSHSPHGGQHSPTSSAGQGKRRGRGNRGTRNAVKQRGSYGRLNAEYQDDDLCIDLLASPALQRQHQQTMPQHHQWGQPVPVHNQPPPTQPPKARQPSSPIASGASPAQPPNSGANQPNPAAQHAYQPETQPPSVNLDRFRGWANQQAANLANKSKQGGTGAHEEKGPH